MQGTVDQISQVHVGSAWLTSMFHADQQFQGIKLLRDAAQGIPDGAYTPVEFDLVSHQSFVSKFPVWSTEQSSQINIPFDGIYVFGGDVRFASTLGVGNCEVLIGTNREDDADIGGDQPVPGHVAMSHLAKTTTNIAISAPFFGAHAFHESDWMRLLVWQNSGTTGQIDNARFFLHRVSDLPGSIERFTTST